MTRASNKTFNSKFQTLKPRLTAVILSTGMLLGVTGCELSKQASDDLRFALTAPGAAPSPAPSIVAPPQADACYTDTYQQPAQQVLHSVDILFVADTSGSMSNKRVKVASALSAFVAALPVGTDYRIGVVLAHGSNDPNSGRLYSKSGIPAVLDSSTMSSATIRSNLYDTMLAAPDYSREEGEMGSYALIKALQGEPLLLSRRAGFFREDAALAVVTISDENDICAAYPSPLPAEFTLRGGHYANMPGMTSSELGIRNRDCASGISSARVLEVVKSVQGDRPFVIGAVIHNDFNYSDSGGNDSYGWGYGQVVNDAHGLLVDIASGDYSAGFASLGALTTTKLQLVSDFKLTRPNVILASIRTLVDRNPVNFEYSAAQNEVHIIQADQLGHALSDVEVQYCVETDHQVPGPSPSPSVTPSPMPSSQPTPDPSPTVTPAPMPSSTPAPSPTPDPTPTPTPTDGPIFIPA